MGEISSGCEEIINAVLFIESSASLMPSLAKVSTTTNMSDRVNHASIKQADYLWHEIGLHRHAISAIAIQHHTAIGGQFVRAVSQCHRNLDGTLRHPYRLGLILFRVKVCVVILA
ncbi:Uncharacterised protein [Vibrio cholerae]|nr:Uncharacterised protein [Vibrio cholerae]